MEKMIRQIADEEMQNVRFAHDCTVVLFDSVL